MADADREVNVRLLEGYRAEATDGRHVVTLDEPEDAGGTDAGMTPVQLLLTALGGCSAITVRMYAARKGWPLEDVSVDVKLYRPARETPRIVQEVNLVGALDDEQRQRLLDIAGRCPVHKLVDGPLDTEERFA